METNNNSKSGQDDTSRYLKQVSERYNSLVNTPCGQILSGRYEIRQLLGQGGMGSVFQALDTNTSQEVAVKVLHPSRFHNSKLRDRFITEARISQQLGHPNIINVFDVQQDNGLFFITMEFLEGQDLRQLLQGRQAAGQSFAEKELLELSESICDALEYAHKFTVHKDLKPENIFLTEDGEYKLMDFGIAQVHSAPQMTQTGAGLGTAYYMAPEQLRGLGSIDGRADVYALGILIYELASGVVPAGVVKPLDEKREDLSKGFCAGVMAAMQSDPNDRPESAREFLNCLMVKKRKAQNPSSRLNMILKWGTAGIAVIAAVTLLLTSGVLSGIGGPDSSTEVSPLANKRMDVIRLFAEVTSLEERLTNALENLEQDAAQSRQDNSEDSSRLNNMLELAEQHILRSNELTELEGEFAVGETLIQQDESLDAASESLSHVRDGYSALLERFNSIDKFLRELEVIDNANNEWGEYQASTGFESPPAYIEFERVQIEVNELRREGQFETATELVGSLAGLLSQARVEAAAEEARIAEAQAEQERQNAQRRAELERQRQDEERRQLAEQEAARQEAVREEQRRLQEQKAAEEAARQEAARQEAARQEAAREEQRRLQEQKAAVEAARQTDARIARYVDGDENYDLETVQTSGPQYPRRALSRNLEGWCIVGFTVNSEGIVVNPRIVESAPGTVFDDSCITTISGWRYESPVVDGKTFDYPNAIVQLKFELED